MSPDHPSVMDALAIIDRFRAHVAEFPVAPPIACVLVHVPDPLNGMALFEVHSNVDDDSVPVFLRDAGAAAAAKAPLPLH